MTRNVIIMVAPNGARKTRLDHASLPVSIEATVSEAAACHAAGASALHAHVRGSNDEHVLDAGLYRELIAEMTRRVPGMLIQITSEAVGIYTPQQQVDCIQAVIPQMVSMGLREISSNFENPGFRLVRSRLLRSDRFGMPRISQVLDRLRVATANPIKS